MLDLHEAVERRRADALGGGVGRPQLRVLGLDVAQLVEQRVVLVVADQRVVEDVVMVVVAGQLAPQLRRPFLVGGGVHTEEGAIAASIRSSGQARRRSSSPWSVRSKWIGVTAIRPSETAIRSVSSRSSKPGCQP